MVSVNYYCSSDALHHLSEQKLYIFRNNYMIVCIFEIVATKYTPRKYVLFNNDNKFHTQ